MIRLPSEQQVASATSDVTVHGLITEIDPDVRNHNGGRHQIFSVQIDQVIMHTASAPVTAGDVVNVAIRFGDGQGLAHAIPGLAVGQPITLSGAYVKFDTAYPEQDGDRHAVIHYTHHPIGWVEYQGVHYE
ncbi:MAG: hypothetical protein JWN15_4093 [Firmicutes bacterium]|nr:hypothetical protein [Bacillota bacterium]